MADKKLSKREKKSAAFRNRKKTGGALSEENAVPEPDVAQDPVDASSDQPSEQKQDRSPAKRAREDNQEQKPAKKRRNGNKNSSDKKRFILFVGNLPKDTTSQQLAAHFESSGELPTVRLMTHKDTNQPKGFAFVEFKESQTLTAALALHRSKFKNKQINVELTAGGGGKSQARQDKLKEKNVRLQQERQKAERRKQASSKKEEQEPESSYANTE